MDTGSAVFDRIPIGSPASTNSAIPAASMARRRASKLFAIGARRPFSKSRTVDRDTFALFASSSWLQSSQPRAARLCSGLNMPGT